jgi:hypothetical protein
MEIRIHIIDFLAGDIRRMASEDASSHQNAMPIENRPINLVPSSVHRPQ